RDPELTALVADAVERNPDLKAAAARVEASRAAVRIAASSLYPRIAMKGLGERQGQRLSGDIGRNINPPDFGSSGVENSGGAGLDTSADQVPYRQRPGCAIHGTAGACADDQRDRSCHQPLSRGQV